MRNVKLLLLVLSFTCSHLQAAVPPDKVELDYLVITVCDVPSIIIFKDKKVIRTMPIAVFFSTKKYEKLGNTILKTPKDKINHVDAAKWTIKPTPCGVTI